MFLNVLKGQNNYGLKDSIVEDEVGRVRICVEHHRGPDGGAELAPPNISMTLCNKSWRKLSK